VVMAVAIAVGGLATAALAVSTSWSTPANLSATGQTANNPHITVDASGRATAIWAHWNGANNIMQASSSLNGATWSTPANLSATGYDANSPEITVDGSGLATAVWYIAVGGNNIVQASTSLNGATWSTPANLSATGYDAYLPQITVAGSGLTTAVWFRRDGANNTIVQASTSLNGVTWSTPANLSAAGRDADRPQITVNGTGLATAVWHRSDGANTIVQASTSLNGGAWSTVANLSAAGQGASNAQITVDGSGLATAVWTRSDGVNYIVQASTSLNGATWSTVADVSVAGVYTSGPQISVNGTGLATAVWHRSDGANTIVQASFFDSGVPVTPPATTSPTTAPATAVIPPELAATGVGPGAVALTGFFALSAMLAGIGMIQTRRTR